ncbi:MAG: hypothetical protein ACM33T_09910 [Solirubrobacterales bacterium]
MLHLLLPLLHRLRLTRWRRSKPSETGLVAPLMVRLDPGFRR